MKTITLNILELQTSISNSNTTNSLIKLTKHNTIVSRKNNPPATNPPTSITNIIPTLNPINKTSILLKQLNQQRQCFNLKTLQFTR